MSARRSGHEVLGHQRPGRVCGSIAVGMRDGAVCAQSGHLRGPHTVRVPGLPHKEGVVAPGAHRVGTVALVVNRGGTIPRCTLPNSPWNPRKAQLHAQDRLPTLCCRVANKPGGFCSFLQASGWLQLSRGGSPDTPKMCSARTVKNVTRAQKNRQIV